MQERARFSWSSPETVSAHVPHHSRETSSQRPCRVEADRPPHYPVHYLPRRRRRLLSRCFLTLTTMRALSQVPARQTTPVAAPPVETTEAVAQTMAACTHQQKAHLERSSTSSALALVTMTQSRLSAHHYYSHLRVLGWPAVHD